MTAFLGQELIFDLDRRGARVFELAHHAHHVENSAVAGVGIDDQRQSAARQIMRVNIVSSSTVMIPRSASPMLALSAAPER